MDPEGADGFFSAACETIFFPEKSMNQHAQARTT